MLCQIGFFLSVIIFLTGFTRADVINVPVDQPTIQAGIVAAVSGVDEVVVASGTYNEAINFLGKAITVRSASGNPTDTIINGTGNFHVVQCVNGEGPGTVLQGFTITGGNANGASFPDDRGGGMLNTSSSPTVTHCTFTGNTAGLGGGMLNFSGSSPMVTNCTFSGNVATDSGGGMHNWSSSPTVTHCTFSSNRANGFGFAGGGGMYNFVSSNPNVTNCTFSGNTAAVFGGGMFNDNNSHPNVTNCTFSTNTAFRGGGMLNDLGSVSKVTNCIFWGDSPDEIINESGFSIISSSNVQGGLPPGTTNGGSNIDLDPQFIDGPGGNLRLQTSSPSIDSGDSSAVPDGVTTDLDGRTRIIDGTVDMGAYEFLPRVHNLTQNSSHGTLQEAIVTADNGDEIEASSGTYYEAIDFLGKAITLRSTSGNPNDTIIDGSGHFNVVRCTSGEGSTTVLEGFTITGGNGSGMFNGYNSSPTVTHCNFSGNTAVDNGGGMHNYKYSSPAVTHCTFTGNTADLGGGMYNQFSSSPKVTHCTFSGNTALSGGGMYNTARSSPTVTHCTFSGNTATSGGGMYHSSSSLTVSSCILWGNTATIGPQIFDTSDDPPDITFSDIQGGLVGMGNIDADPLFVDVDGADNTIGTDDDDLRLLPGSPCIDSGNFIDFISLIDLGGNDRSVDDPTTLNTGTGALPYLDMGAYEFQVLPCSGLEGDINCDGIVNMLDLSLLAMHWLETI